MRILFAGLVLGALLVPATVRADSHFADFYGGGSGGGGGSKLGGFIVAFGKSERQPEPLPGTPPEKPKKVLFGGVGGVSVQFGSHDDGSADVMQVVWSVGPRLTFEKNRNSKNFYHAQVTFGGSHTNDGQLQSNFATVVGAAYDHVFGTHAGPTPHPGLGMRLQADRVFRSGENAGGNIWRLSAGLIYRVPKL